MNVISPIFLHHTLNSQHPNMCQNILFLTLGFSILKETCMSQKKDFGLWCIGQSLKKKPIFQTAVWFGALDVSTPGASHHNKVQSEQGHVSVSLRIGNLCYSDKQPLHFSGLKQGLGTSLVAQWLRICLPVQATRVRSLVREDPTCCGATEPHAPQLLNLRSRAHEPQLLSPRAATTAARMPRACARQQSKATAMRSPHTATKSSPRSPQLEKARTQQ